MIIEILCGMKHEMNVETDDHPVMFSFYFTWKYRPSALDNFHVFLMLIKINLQKIARLAK